MASQPERISSLETARNYQWLFLVAATLAAVGWLSYLTVRIDRISQGLAGVEGKIGAPLSAALHDLQEPSSPLQLQAGLNTVVAQIQNLNASGKKPDGKLVHELSTAVAGVVQRSPEIPATWRAASELVNIRPLTLQRVTSQNANERQPLVAGSRNCFSYPDQFTPDGRQTGHTAWVLYNCTVSLDDIDAFKNSQDYRTDALRYAGKPFDISLVLINVRVLYSGGTLVPVRRIRAVNCTYEFDVQSKPAAAGTALVEALLGSETTVNSFTFDKLGDSAAG